MKETVTSNVVSTTGTTNAMSIEVNASMFQLLSRKVYNDPIAAVIREWSTNAIDVCLQANLIPQFDVHLPTSNEPYFFVRDYGTGLSKEDILGRFAVLGASTKRNDNATNGTFGVGRMAGLAYATSFTIESFYEGTHSVYVVSIIDGIPNTIELSHTSTTEPNGLKLSVNVESSDFSYFNQSAKRIYRYFNTKPNLNIDLDINRDESNDLSPNWFIDHTLPTSNNYVLMSNVMYEIPYNDKLKQQGFSRLVFKLPNGSVTFNPGRESLSLDTSSIDLLNNKFKEVLKDYSNAVSTQLATKTNQLDIIKEFTNYIQSAPYSVRSNLNIQNYLSPMLQSMSSSGTSIENTTIFKAIYNNRLILRYKYSHNQVAKDISYESCRYSDLVKCKYLIIDQKTNFSHAIRSFEGNNLVVIIRTEGTSLEDFLPEAKKFLSDLGVTEYTLSSSLAPTKEERIRQSKDGIHVCYHKGTSFNQSIKYNPDTKYWYIPVTNTTPIFESDEYEFSDYIELYNAYKKLDSDAPKLVGVQKKYLSLVEEHKNFELFLPNIIPAISSKEINLYHDQVTKFPHWNVNECEYMPESIKECNEIAKSHQEANSTFTNWYKDILDKFKIPYTIVELPHDLLTIHDKYPLFKEFAYHNSDLPKLKHYLKLEHYYDSIRRT